MYKNQNKTPTVANIQLVGYARVSSQAQDLQLQIDALKNEGCLDHNIFVDKVSGSKADRPGLNEALKTLREGGTLIVWRLDRLGRSMTHLVSIIEALKKRNISFKSIRDGDIDTTTASGELVFNIFSCLAQFERRLIQERTNAGLAAARARGKHGGRPKMTASHPKVKMAKKLYSQKMEIAEICELLNISRPTLYRYLKLES